MKLYQISSEFRRLFDQMSNADEWDEESLVAIEELSQNFNEKASNIGAYIKELNAEASALSQAALEMTMRAKRLYNKVDSLTNYLKMHMEQNDVSHVNSLNAELKLKKNPVSVAIHDETAIPEGYYKHKGVYTLDKALIKLDIERGIEVPGATLESKIRLEIK